MTQPSAEDIAALMELNAVCLAVAVDRVARFRPECYEANILEPVTIEAEKFDSIGMNYVLHCVPGTIRTKAVVFEHLKALASPGAAPHRHRGQRRRLCWTLLGTGSGTNERR